MTITAKEGQADAPPRKLSCTPSPELRRAARMYAGALDITLDELLTAALEAYLTDKKFKLSRSA